MYLLLDAVSITARLKCNVPRLVQQAKFPFLEFTFTSVLHPGMPMTGIQYNTIQMSFDIALLTGNSELHLYASAAQM